MIKRIVENFYTILKYSNLHVYKEGIKGKQMIFRKGPARGIFLEGMVGEGLVAPLSQKFGSGRFGLE